MKLIDKYSAKVKMLDTADSLKLDQVIIWLKLLLLFIFTILYLYLCSIICLLLQAHLETVIPAVGKPVLILNGGYAGNKAILTSLNERKFSVSVELMSGPLKGRKVDDIPYEDISKLSDCWELFVMIRNKFILYIHREI